MRRFEDRRNKDQSMYRPQLDNEGGQKDGFWRGILKERKHREDQIIHGEGYNKCPKKKKKAEGLTRDGLKNQSQR